MQIVNINSYAKLLLIKFLKDHPEWAMEVDISEIPDCATQMIQANVAVMFSQIATRHILAECWNEVEIALDDWKENTGMDYPVGYIEQLHVFSIARHAEMAWRNITDRMLEDHLCEETIAEAINWLEHW